jgi:hypothetical protein
VESPTLACGKLPGVHGDLGATTEQGDPMTAAASPLASGRAAPVTAQNDAESLTHLIMVGIPLFA